MPCYGPLKGWMSKDVTGNGKRTIVFDIKEGFTDRPIDVACGQCIGCKLERSRQWAMRCMHEASLYDENCFITLTYDEFYIPKGGTLVKKDFQLFMKRLRKRYGTSKIRYYACGEYGELSYRPHFHACIFAFDFSDKVLFKEHNGNDLYTSDSLNSLWNYGFATIGNLTFESAAYVARYCTKIITGEMSEKHYAGREKEFSLMSRRPGIGQGWIEKFHEDTYKDDKVIIRGQAMSPPTYYDRYMETKDNDVIENVKKGRRMDLYKVDKGELSGIRLNVKETVKKASITQLKRTI